MKKNYVCIKDRFKSQIEDEIAEVFYPADKRKEIENIMGKKMLEIQDIKMYSKINPLVAKTLSLFEAKLDECKDEIALELLRKYAHSTGYWYEIIDTILSIIKSKMKE